MKMPHPVAKGCDKGWALLHSDLLRYPTFVADIAPPDSRGRLSPHSIRLRVPRGIPCQLGSLRWAFPPAWQRLRWDSRGCGGAGRGDLRRVRHSGWRKYRFSEQRTYL